MGWVPLGDSLILSIQYIPNLVFHSNHRYNSLKNKVQKNNSQDKRASGISPEETESQRELRVLLEDLANQEDDAELLPKTNASEEEQRRLDGQEVQKRACESFVETRKR